MKPLVSVVIPTIAPRYEQLERAIDSINNQTYNNIELVVVDEGLPATVQRNIGIERSNGDFIAFLDDDDTWEPAKIEKQMKVMSKYPDCPLVVCYSEDHRFGKETISQPPFVADQKMVLNAFNYSSTSTYLVRKYSLELVSTKYDLSKIETKCGSCSKQHICWSDFGIGIWSKKDLFCDTIRHLLKNQHKKQYFDESLRSAQEYDIAIALSKYNNVRCVDEVLVVQNVILGQISEDWDKKRKGILQVYKKHMEEFNRASSLNWVKVFGLYVLFSFGFLFGNRIYWILSPMKKRHEVVEK